MSKNQLQLVREKIDSLDKQLYELIKQRGELAIDVAKIKQQDANAQYYRPERESQVLRNIMHHNESLISDRAMAQIFRDIMTACLALQKQLTIAYLGPQGTFCQMATEQHFGKAIESVAADNIDDVFHLVESNKAHYGVVPIENSSEGTVHLTLDSFFNTTLQIVGEIHLPIHHHFMHQAAAEQQITTILSHQQSLAQCRLWLNKNHPNVTLQEVSSNSVAALRAAANPSIAAISTELAAELYGLSIKNHHIEDHRLNTTRFIIVGKQSPEPSGKDKTSLLISSPHKPGSLLDLLLPFKQAGINMSMIESRPYKQRNWSYVFFIDIEGHQQDKKVKQALEKLSSMAVMMTILGSYPRSIT